MSESTERGKPTPGPWSYRSTGEILTADGEIIGRISYGKIGWIGGGDAHANADLIAAAPEMGEEMLNAYHYADLPAETKAKWGAILKKAGLL